MGDGVPGSPGGGAASPRSPGISSLLEDLIAPEGAPAADATAWRPAPEPGTRIGRFEIVSELGRGGFGIVYEALDRDLGRSVAFKLLQGSARPTAREERLLREAETAARLSHPNVVTLHDAGRSEYGPYLVLELLRGETLADRLAAGPVPLAMAVRVAVEIGRGLSQAHAQGIVHRDLSPRNVFLCADGHVKLLDLGMAQAFGRRKVEGGTPAYMAPEQWRGAPEDERTDVFALGVLLYRMLAGELPFPDDDGRSAAGPRRAPLIQVPEAPDLPAIVDRMLAKDPVDRYRDAGEVVAALTPVLRAVDGVTPSGEAPPARRRRRGPGWKVALGAVAVLAAAGAFLLLGETRRPQAVPFAGPIPAVAVLPFSDLSPAQDQGHFADGLAEEILNALVQVDGLRVAGRTSSFSFRGKGDSLADIGRQLKVDAVLDGSVRQSGSRLRVNAQLVSVQDGYQIWSRTFEREVADVFAVQDEIAGAVAQALRVKLAPGRPVMAAERRTAVPEAYEKYLLGRQLYYARASNDGFRGAIGAFERSIAADPGYAPAWAGLATALAAAADYAATPGLVAELKSRAVEAADRAVVLGPDIPDGYGARGFVRAGIQRDWPGVRADFERSLALNPRHPDTLRRYGTWYLGATGRIPEAVAALQAATEREPLFVYAWTDLALLHLANGNLPAARTAIDRALEIDPDNRLALRHLATLHLLEGDPQGALSASQRNPEPLWRDTMRAIALHDLGRDAESRAALAELKRTQEQGGAYQIAEVHAWRGESDDAFAWLEQALAQDDSGLALEVKGDPLLRRIRGDPRYAAFLARMNLGP
ncbi:MAG TPA: protein kinase [Anaeromyxobacteraceae bacterium]|nr:protein kinase [Anaeromyxobacteraceae bacterium]